MPNRLIREQSPYLLQHAHNPVDWYPWGDEAFEQAQKTNKPVLVSIGYAACHWCHVMERESFENEEVAKFMNEHFINIKVDREEHPDVDGMYMDAVQAISGNGGWPLNVFVTAERVPFYGGTYFPPKELYGRVSWTQLLERMNDIWINKNGEVKLQTEQMIQYLKNASAVATKAEQKKITIDTNNELVNNLLKTADSVYGGFGKAPKFPSTMAIKYLLDSYHFFGNEEAFAQALLSVDALIDGGIYDQIGGGLARYSTDDKWLAPHFEKMLYDNALLISLLCDAYSLTGNNRYKEVIEETIAFCDRELYNASGGYFCALDADSEGVEGKFYTWSWEEWNTIVKDDILAEYFGVEESGNWEGTNILHVNKSVEELSKKYGEDQTELTQKIKVVKQQLFNTRAKRVRPSTDDKTLLSWNALMNTALSKAAAALGNRRYLLKAKKHLEWLLQTFVQGERVLHSWKNGEAKIVAKLDDIAYLIAAIIDNTSVSGESENLLVASKLVDIANKEFLHDDKSFYYYSSSLQKDIPVRKVDVYDGALPSGNAVMANNLQILGICLEKNNWIEQGEYLVNIMHTNSVKYPISFGHWAQLIQYNIKGLYTIIFAGDKGVINHEYVLKKYTPNVFKLLPRKGVEDLPILKHKSAEGDSQIYVCNKEQCFPPNNNVEEVIRNL